MYISKLKIQGFKSFLNKTELNFGEGITTVVGPNGCGKTNIVDAIRWILGEQKTSVLRSTKMEDVIFNGSKNRKPVGMCEASLTIHNNMGMLPTEYTDVEITRRLFRSGESEYLLNKTPCRLKDIHELFMDTGMSSNAYSVIELKMIDSILSHNADDRRGMFEEAAGINQYKKQRQSTFRKLESTMLDVARVNDIISEVDGTLRNLRLQLKRYDRHQKMTADLKSTHILLAQAEIQSIQMERLPLEKNLQSGRGQQQAIAGQLSLEESLISQTQSRYESLKKELAEKQQALDSVEEDLSAVNNNILIWTEQKKGNESNVQHYSDEIQQSKGRLASLQSQVEELEGKISAISPELESRSQKFTSIQTEYASIDAQYLSQQTVFNDFKKNHDDINRHIYKSESNIERVLATIHEKENYIQRLKEQKVEVNEKVQSYEADINLFKAQINSKESENGKLNLNVEKLQESHAELESKLMIKQSELATEKTSLIDSQNKLKFYEDILEKNEGRSSGIKWVMSSNKFKGVVGVLGDLVSAKKGHELAVNAALGRMAGYLVVADLQTARHILEKVTEEKRQISIIPLAVASSFKVPTEKESHILNYMKYDKNIASALHIILDGVHFTKSAQTYSKLSQKEQKLTSWVTLTGERFDGTLVLRSQRVSANTASIGRVDKIKALNKKITSTNKTITSLEKDISTLTATANTAFNKVDANTHELDDAMKFLYELEKELSQREYIISQQGNSTRDIQKRLTVAEKEVTHLNIQLSDEKKKSQEFKASLNTSELKLKTLMDEQESLRVERNELQQSLQDARVSVVEVQKENEGLVFRFKNASDRVGELGERIKKFTLDSELLTDEIVRLSKSTQTATNEKSALIAKQTEYSESKAKLESAFNQSHEELQSLQSNIRDQQKVKEARILELQQVELNLAQLTQAEALIRGRIQETYREEIPDTDEFYEEINIDELREQVTSIDKSLERIGAINMAAQAEFEREEDRYNFLKEQYDDLIESEKSLKETIDKLDCEARSKFIKTYEEIREFFKKTYTMFFDGGEAQLRLVGDDDPLEASIEIIAKPPGKKPQTLRMLSAGEKALTAISLLFAIYMVKPSPFCILDEVDAPLDDRNIGKFTKVLKQFSEKTQFIVVTHNKLTMEKADYLYGVTQKEEGVSQIVSVKFAGDVVASI
ncbi:MAG: chromosome segregation protein SMC [Candidatus Marinimicrobia bacterium]|nr:chromosome segregation protein SMC [Candidatus Neomarinimicrobiota bacterium]